MKWAADPMMPFRRVEHWLWDLYLIDQQVQNGEKMYLSSGEVFLPAATTLFQSLSLFNRKEQNKTVLFNYTNQRIQNKIKGLYSLWFFAKGRRKYWAMIDFTISAILGKQPNVWVTPPKQLNFAHGSWQTVGQQTWGVWWRHKRPNCLWLSSDESAKTGEQ